MRQEKLANRIAIVTGGASGIGKATAEQFASEGAKVVIGDLADSAGAKVAAAIGGTFVATDVREAKQVEALVKHARDLFGRLDVMFNNAGISVNAPLLTTTEEDYRNSIRIDLDGVFWGLKFGGKAMVEQKRGSIINTCGPQKHFALA